MRRRMPFMNDFVSYMALCAATTTKQCRNEKKSEKQFSFNRILKVSKFELFSPHVRASQWRTRIRFSLLFFSIKLIASRQEFMEFEWSAQKWNKKKLAKNKKNVNDDDEDDVAFTISLLQCTHTHKDRVWLRVTSAKLLFI